MADPDAGDVIYPEDLTTRLDAVDQRLLDLETLNPACRVRNYGGVSVPETSDTVIPLEVNPYNIGGMHPGAGFVTNLVLPQRGIYVMFAQQYWDIDTAGIRRGAVRRNGTADVFTMQGEGVGGADTPLNGGGEAFFDAGEFLQLIAYKESGDGGPALTRCWMTVRYVRTIP